MKEKRERGSDLATRLGLNHDQLGMLGEVVGNAERDERLRRSREIIVSEIFGLFPDLKEEAKASREDPYYLLVDKIDSDERLSEAFFAAKEQAELSVCLTM